MLHDIDWRDPAKAFAVGTDFKNSGNVTIARMRDTEALEAGEQAIEPIMPEEEKPDEPDEVSPEHPVNSFVSNTEMVPSGSTDEEVQELTEEMIEAVGKQPEFYYEQECDGVKIVLSADEGVVPAGASVSVQPLNKWQELTMKDEIQSAEQDKMLADGKKGHTAIYNMYRDLQVSVDQMYAFDFEITYEENGEICIFEPSEEQSVSVSMEFIGLDLEETEADEMQKMGLYYVPDAYLLARTGGWSARRIV